MMPKTTPPTAIDPITNVEFISVFPSLIHARDAVVMVPNALTVPPQPIRCATYLQPDNNASLSKSRTNPFEVPLPR
jgi:hypothetical protein